ncbi:hypothetical protein SLS54_008797 [Diplodia seriata]
MMPMFRIPSHESFVELAKNLCDSADLFPQDFESATAVQQQQLDPSNKPKIAKGTLPSTRTLYECRPDPHSCDNGRFQEEYPKDLLRKKGESVQVPEDKLYALVVRERRTGVKARPLRMDTVTVQSPYLKAALAKILVDCNNVDEMKLRNPVFKKPYRELYYAWPAFEKMVAEKEKESRDGDGDAEVQHLRLFYDLTVRDVERLRRKQLPLDRQNKVTFDTLFTALRPGTVVYGKVGVFDRFFKVKSVEYHGGSDVRPYSCSVRCLGLEWDGDELGWAVETFSLYRWLGAKRLVELNVFPAELHPEYNTIRAQLLERGKRWDSMRSKPTVVEYGGSTLKIVRDMALWDGGDDGSSDGDDGGDGGGVPMVKGRVVIDPAAHRAEKGFGTCLDMDNVFSDDPFKPILPLESGGELQNAEEDDEDDAAGYESDPDSDDEETGKQTQEADSGKTDLEDEPLSDDMLVLASHIITGFCLRTKAWVKLHIDHTKDVSWNYEAFDRLVLPGNFKQLILAFVESQSRNRDVFDDIIEGKGQGIIMLLHGAPGLGKTLTAEAVADRIKKPLYSVQAGELGCSANKVEKKLEKILKRAATWDAVLLLDEADVFLEQRHHSDLERNKIVSVFLRLLEYYRGILFLTSNRVESFDEAFRSRIHLQINYPNLDTEAKTGIWKSFIEASRKKNGSHVTESDIKKLAELPFNGREIKNMVKTAQLLASREKWPLEMRHFKVCLEVLEDGKGEQGKASMV